jgi:subtilisin family serine protease
MKKIIQHTLALLALLLVTFSCTQNPVDPIKDPGVQNSTYIVVFNQDGNSIQSNNVNANIKEIFSKHGIELSALKYTYDVVLTGFAATLTEYQVKALIADKSIKYVEKDQVIALDDELEGVILKGRPPTETPPTTNWGIQSIGGNVQANSSTGVAWVVDTGIDYDRSELNVDKNLSWNYVNNTSNANDDNGHGSHCAGIIAANNSDIGICKGAKVIAIKVLDSRGNGWDSDIIEGLDYIGSKLYLFNLNAVNMSLGGTISQSLDDAVTRLAGNGANICIAAGNSKKFAGNYSPSRVNGTKIFTISAHDINGKFASFSNWGNPPVDYAAPGVTIYSCYKDGGYAWMSGTSMAAPHCCGIILARGGSIGFNGYVTNDRDNDPDKKAHRINN